jgi:glycosyltransferase involved in cell wall biosynthesis
VVAHDYAAARELIVSGRNGLAVPMDDDGAFVDAACELARDVSRARMLGAAAHITAQTRDWTEVARRLEAVLAAAARGADMGAMQDAARWPARQAG